MTAAAVAWEGTGKVATGSNATSLGSASLAVTTDVFVEGTNCCGEKVSNATRDAAFSGAAITGEPFDLSTTSENIYVWINIAGGWDTLANGGFGIFVVDDAATDAEGAWYVGPRPGYIGGWVPFVVHPSRDFHSVVAGTPSWTTTGNPSQLNPVDAIGARWKVTTSIMGASDNAFVDAVSLGLGYRLTLGDAGSTEGAFSDFITFEENVSNRYGGLVSRDGILFAQCQLIIGAASGATNTEFISDGETVIWSDVQTSTESAVEADFYKLSAEKGTGTTDLTCSNGLWQAISPQEVYIDLSAATTAVITNQTVDGARLIDLGATTNWNGGTIKNSGMIDLGGTVTAFKDVTIKDPTDVDALQVDATTELTNVENLAFDGAGTGGAGSSAILLTPNGGTYAFKGITFANRVSGSHDIRIPSSTTVATTINITGGGDPSPTVNDQGSGGYTIVANAIVTFDKLKDNSEVRVYAAGTSTELAGIENATAGSADNRNFPATVTQGTSVDYTIISNSYEIIRVEGFTWPTTDQTLDIQQRLDRNYSNP